MARFFPFVSGQSAKASPVTMKEVRLQEELCGGTYWLCLDAGGLGSPWLWAWMKREGSKFFLEYIIYHDPGVFVTFHSSKGLVVQLP